MWVFLYLFVFQWLCSRCCLRPIVMLPKGIVRLLYKLLGSFTDQTHTLSNDDQGIGNCVVS